ncbi:uncharacterized protein MONOS_12788 [Monocercomonoides exilis]|uniref:uncharacterized protein n=1 Tax=Monocercomonoides exilis TaxID=2049356 RepID=UPI0035599F1D|nr:hypothetical protein MONOS_12788 [Monocercomonoides exilis]|eukprot:MONOS_12788.1-p1 / transcript=MONOS_12788.1 / gene=MONOS_12788 / organism=Monocercomonoides_exilis_PA203 / gene_product=unspecified product / transcript_product=unspecified product / location=Mono_scaffold00733:7807-9443(-) / protein_length=273 / sequence_SO=supercontig / SO=protein_coding / is_pseudo=false
MFLRHSCPKTQCHQTNTRNSYFELAKVVVGLNVNFSGSGEEKKAGWDKQPVFSSSSSSSSARKIDSSDASAVAVSYTSEVVMDDIERQLESCSVGGHEIGEQADLCIGRCECNLFITLQLALRSPQSMRVVVRLDDEVMGRGVAVCEVGGIVGKGLDAERMRKEEMVLSPAAIALEVLEEWEEAEEGEMEETEGGDGNEEKGGRPIAHREFVEGIKENQGKLEEAIAQLVVEALGLSRLRFVKARTATEASAGKKFSVQPEMRNFSPADGIR